MLRWCLPAKILKHGILSFIIFFNHNYLNSALTPKGKNLIGGISNLGYFLIKKLVKK